MFVSRSWLESQEYQPDKVIGFSDSGNRSIGAWSGNVLSVTVTVAHNSLGESECSGEEERPTLFGV
jgi:hypothetical protein